MPKQPDFTLSSNSGCEGLNVAFQIRFLAMLHLGCGIWRWININITESNTFFDSAGVFDIKLTTNINGHCILSTVRLSELEVFSNPHITFSSDTNIGCSIPLDVAFYDSTVGAISWVGILRWKLSNLENFKNLC